MIAATSTYRPCPARESPALPIRTESLRLPGRARRVAEVTSSPPAAATIETERMATLAPHARPLVRRRSAPAGLQDALPRQVSFDRVSAFAWERSEGGAVAARVQDGEAGVIDEPDITVVSYGASARVVEEPRISPPRPICRRGRMHANPPPAPLPLGPPPTLESAPSTPAFTDDKTSKPNDVPLGNKELPQTRMGMCVVCLENDVEVLDASWLHREEEGVSRAGQNGAENGSDEKCQVSACPGCLETYFKGVVDSGFDGACPRMRCMMCPRVICEQTWRPLVDESVLDNFRRRVNILLSLQCGGCHSREDFMVFPLPTQSYSEREIRSGSGYNTPRYNVCWGLEFTVINSDSNGVITASGYTRQAVASSKHWISGIPTHPIPFSLLAVDLSTNCVQYTRVGDEASRAGNGATLAVSVRDAVESKQNDFLVFCQIFTKN